MFLNNSCNPLRSVQPNRHFHRSTRRFSPILPMITLLRSVVFCSTTFALGAGFLAAQAPPIRIMPLGDSITDGTAVGTAGYGGYRLPLYNSLTAAGYNVDYIGSLTNNGASIPDKNHEGHGGWRIDQLDSNILGWLGTMEDPDVVLMHIGTNDFGQSFNTATAIDRLDGLILKIATARPFCHIIVTNLMERGEPANANIQALFNPYVEARVNAHAGAGRRVTFLDMRSAVPLSDMPDALHPNQTGYDKMAAAWLPAIQAVISPNGDNAPPVIAKVRGGADQTQVVVTFSKPVADSAASISNFSIDHGLSVLSAELDAAKRKVTLTTSAQTLGTLYTVTVNDVEDRLTPTPSAILPNSTATFFPQLPRGYLNHVPESADYTLAATLEIPNSALWRNLLPAYSVDNRATIGSFDRVAYYLELQAGDGQLQYLWASMDAFTANAFQLAVPTVATGAQFQQTVTNMTVVSNADGVTEGTGLSGHLEFWPTNYQAANGAAVAGASETAFDFGDQPSAGTYGSMQLHHPAAGQTLFALNNWGAASGTPGDIDLGMGNDPAPVNNGVDWTFHHNASIYTIKTLQILVRTTGDLSPPLPTGATASFGRTKVTGSFSEPLRAASVRAENFSLSDGVVVLGADLLANQREVSLTTTAQPAAVPMTLTISGVRDTAAAANLVPSGTTILVAPAQLPSEITANVGAASTGYQLVYSADLPVTGSFVSAGAGAYRVNDSAAFGNFTRVAYYLELQAAGGPVQFVWASMDAYTISRAKLALPVGATGAVFQENVTNLDVLSNVPGVVNGLTATGGNIEIWPTDYSAANGASVPGASATTYDFGDTRTATGNFGSLQIHNHDALQTVLAVNHFGADGNVLDVGIGNQSTSNPDWTFAANAGNYTRRVLHVLVLPGVTTNPALVAKVPEAADYQLVYSLNIPTAGNLVSGVGFTNYSINRGAEVAGFSRVAYYMELQKTGDAEPRYVWTSMDAFTNLGTRIGIPTASSGAVFQQTVSNLEVASNVPGVVTGQGIATGNIEFWPTNYSQANALGIPNANAATYDFGDTRSTSGTHGSMQVHNYGAAQTLWALNNWGAAGNSANVLAMGIGNNPTVGQAPDYTLTANGASWDLRRVLQVYVKPGNSDTAPPTLTRAVGSRTLDRLVVTFSEPVADSASALENYSISGLTIQRAELLPGRQDVALYTSAQTPGTTYTVQVTGVRDRSGLGNLLAAGASATFAAYAPPPILASIPETSDYRLVYQLAIPSSSPQWNINAIPYSVDEAKYGEQLFDRVAYLLELDANWAYASFDRHTSEIAKVGIPTQSSTTTAFQQLVTHMNVAASPGSGVTTGTDLATGNIEFWGGNYSSTNALGIPNASAAIFDFGDQMTTGGYGCLQIHNHGASQVVLAYNNWAANVAVSDLGIGNHPTPSATTTGAQLDWTFSANATAYSTRNLYVLVRPGGTPTGATPNIFAHPVSSIVAGGGSLTLSVQAGGVSPLSYQWRKGGQPIPGAVLPWLTLTGLTTAATGDYDVVVTGGNLASTTSLAAAVVVNSPPTFSGYSVTTLKNQIVEAAFSALLAQASDPDNDSLSVTGVSAASAHGGTLTLTASGITYLPPLDYLGPDSFSFTLTDVRGASAQAVIQVAVLPESGWETPAPSVTLQPGGSVQLQFFGVPGFSYQIQRSTDLQNWIILDTLVAPGSGALPYEDTAPPAGRAYYRTRLVL